MATAVIIKQEGRRAHEEAVLRSFGVQGGTAAQREAAEVIAARSVEVVKGGKENGKRYY